MPHALAWLILMLEVHGTGACPAPAAVEARLREALPLASGATDADPLAGPADEARLEERPDGTLEVILLGGRGVRGRKTLPSSLDCSERAEMAAVALAIWEERLRSGVSLHVDGLPAPPPAPPPEASVAASPSPATSIARAATPLPAPANGPWLESIGVGALGVARGPTAGARLDVRGAVAVRWRPRLSLAALGPERLDFPPGEATWTRVFGVAGAELVVWRRPVSRHGSRAAWALAAGAGAALGWLHVNGRGFADDRASTNIDLGFEGGLRLEAGLAPWRPWLGASVLSWLRAQDVALSGATGARSLPPWDLVIALGIDWLPNW